MKQFLRISLFLLLTFTSTRAIAQSLCQPDFTFNNSNCPTVSFFDASTCPSGSQIVSWTWYFATGATSNQQNPVYTYTNNGDYLVILQVTDNFGNSAYYADTVPVHCIPMPPCEARFQALTGNCPTIAFYDSSHVASGDSILSYSWNFGDGNTSSLENPVHTYTQNGTYTVCLTILSSSGCQDTFCNQVQVNCVQPPSCQAMFQYSIPAACTTVVFQDASTASPGNVVSWFWNFGDGTTSTQQNPTHTYPGSGLYNATLTITTSDSCTSTVQRLVTAICQPTCQASFAYFDNCPVIHFYDSTTFSTGDSIVSWNWNFGDGGTASHANPVYTYQQNGNYAVCLSIVTAGGCQSTFCDTISINCITPSTCGAGFQFTMPNCSTAIFTDYSTSTPNPIVSWNWSFGDGSGSTMQHPNHVWTSNGDWPVCLTITTSDGCSSTFCDTVSVNCPPNTNCQAGFQFNNQCPVVFFTDLSTSGPNNPVTVRNWNFGDGSTSGSRNPVHTFSQDGTYIVCLTILTQSGCSSTFCDTVVINCLNVSCQASFGWQAPTGSPVAFFQDQSTANPGTVSSWHWDFGDGTTDPSQNPIHTYPTAGTYLTCLTITTTDSCVSTTCDTVNITLNGLADSFAADFSLEIFPQPAQDQLNLRWDQSSSHVISIELTDLTGRVLKKREEQQFAPGKHQMQLSLAELPQGLYLLRMKRGKRMATRRIAVQR